MFKLSMMKDQDINGELVKESATEQLEVKGI